MTQDEREVVHALQAALAERVGSQRFAMWFEGHTRLSLAGGVLTISVSSPFYQDWLRNNFRREIEASCVTALGKVVPIAFEVDAQLASDTQPEMESTLERDGQPKPTREPSQAAQAVAAPLRLVAIDNARPAEAERKSTARRFASLGTFVVGPENRLAHVSAVSTAERLGHTSPLLVYGPTGAGKTHLLEGIWIAAKKANPALHAVYLSAEQFTTYFLQALQGTGLPSFRNKYRGVGLLIVDDLQFFAGKKATLVELLHTIDTLLRDGRQLVFAADRPATQLTELGPELITRLQGGLACELGTPGFETRRGIVRQLADRLEMDLAPEVEAFVAAHVTSHARALAGAVNRLRAYSQAHGEPITFKLAEAALSDLVQSPGRGMRLAEIEQAVCNVFGLDPKALRSDRKGKAIDHPRMLAMWLARKHTRAALSEIGEYFGRRSHTTVISAQKRINTFLAASSRVVVADRDCQVDEAIRRVEAKLAAS